MVARLLVAGSARTGREARSGDGAGATAPPLLLRGDRRGAARRLRPCARGRPACRHHDVGAVALPAREPPALPAPPRRSGGRPDGGVGVSGGGSESRRRYRDLAIAAPLATASSPWRCSTGRLCAPRPLAAAGRRAACWRGWQTPSSTLLGRVWLRGSAVLSWHDS